DQRPHWLQSKGEPVGVAGKSIIYWTLSAQRFRASHQFPFNHRKPCLSSVNFFGKHDHFTHLKDAWEVAHVLDFGVCPEQGMILIGISRSYAHRWLPLCDAVVVGYVLSDLPTLVLRSDYQPKGRLATQFCALNTPSAEIFCHAEGL